MTKTLLFALFLYTIFEPFLPNQAFLIGGSAVWYSDILIVITTTSIVIKYGISHLVFNIKKHTLSKNIFIILLLLILPILTGILNGHNIISVFRDARSLFLCIIPFMFLLELNTFRKWFKYIKFIFITFFILLFILTISFVFNIPFNYLNRGSLYETEYGTIHLYGLSSAFSWYPLILFFSFTCLLTGLKTALIKNRSYQFILFALSFLAVYLSGARGYFISIMIGLILNILFLHSYLNKKLILIFILSIILLIGFNSSITQLLSKTPIIERYITATNLDDNNIKLRTNVFQNIDELIDNKIIGEGYGGQTQSGSEEGFSVYNITHLLALNSYAWAIYRMGYLGLILFLLFYLRFAFKIKKHITTENDTIYVLFNSIRIYLFTVLFMASSGNLFFRGTSGTISVAILIGLILSLESVLPEIQSNTSINTEIAL